VGVDRDPYALPPDLPVPVDNRACDHLRGTLMPSVVLRSTRGRLVNVGEIAKHPTVFFFYPETGKPGDPIPEAWNRIPGARGCTPQNCGFRDRYQEFGALGFEVFGVSGQGRSEEQGLAEQMEFAERAELPFELLNDSRLELTRALRLPTFQFEGRAFIERLALVADGRRIDRVFYPVFPPDKNAEMVLEYLGGR